MTDAPSISTPLEQLQTRYTLDLAHILGARAKSAQLMAEFRKAIAAVLDRQDPSIGVIVNGSVARQECTAGSDIDWTLLVDGRVQNDHLDVAKNIERIVKDKFKKDPNPNGAFANLVISHNLVHWIGGDTDSNKNTTQRILLLLESASLADDQARRRVVRAILERYLEQDTHFDPTKSIKVPRFLINDVVRYWRTMAVDYASKHRSDAGRQFAIRNIKLRLSRKLIFISGLLMAYACNSETEVNTVSNQQSLFGTEEEEAASTKPYIELLADYVDQPPLDILANTCLTYHVAPGVVRDLFEAYDFFLGKLDDEQIRDHLKKIDYQTAKTDPIFRELREVSHRFQSGVNALFFETDKTLAALTKEYAVF